MRTLVLEARCLHIGFLGCYGNEWIATPNLDRLAAEGVVFDQHILDCPDLARNGSVNPRVPVVGVQNFGKKVLERWQSSANLLWIDGPNLAPPWDLPADLRGVYFDDEDQAEPWLDPPTDVVGELSIDELVELQNTYAAAVTWFDAQVGVILDALRDAGELDETLVCVTASAGLPLGEHGQIGAARAWLHEELVHVPLLIRFPNRQHAGARVNALTQPADVLATLTDDAVGGSGHDLRPLLRAETDSVRPRACSSLTIGDSVEWALRTPEWAFLLPINVADSDAPRGPQLFVKPDDRWEVNDVRQHHLELVEEFVRILRETVKNHGA